MPDGSARWSATGCLAARGGEAADLPGRYRWDVDRHSEPSGDQDDHARVARLLGEASELLGPGSVLLQIWSSPVVEWVFVGVEGDSVVVSDNGQAFGWVSGLRLPGDRYLPWSVAQAAVAARRFNVELRDEGGDGYEAFRLVRAVQRGESAADVVQAVALAIDGTLALHTPPDSPTYDSYFWDRSIAES